MKLFAKTEYACIAVLELALRHGAGQPVRIREIAETHGIPARFLVQILLQLKGAGIVVSTRGAGGGYQLAKPPEQISLGEVMSIIAGDQPWQSAANGNTPTTRVLLKTWRDAAEQERQHLRGINFANLVERCQVDLEQMYYI